MMKRFCMHATGALRLTLSGLTLLAVLARPVPQLAEPDYTLYHTKDSLFQAVRDVVASCPSIMRIDEQTAGDANYSSTLTVVTVQPAGLSDASNDKIRLLLNFGEHGRELISSEIGLHLLRLLCDPAARRPLLAAYGVSEAAVDALLPRTVFKIIPMENVRGRERVEQGQLCERKNGRGVDPNRNWEVHWGFKEKDYDPREEFPGAQPFSEPEAALLLGTARALRPHVWTSVHSGMQALFMPYDHVARIPDGEGPAATLGILNQINKRTCGGKCAVGSGGKSVGYLAHGTATDYMYERLGVPLSMTWEVYGDDRAVFEDCFRMFNPLTWQAYNATVESWTAAVFTLLTLLPQHPQLQAELHLTAGNADSETAGSAASRAVAGDSSTGNGDAAAFGRRGGAGAASGQQAEQQQQQDPQGGAVSVGDETGLADQTGSSDGGSSSSAGKALEIAEALKEHLQQQESSTQQQARQQGGGEAGAAHGQLDAARSQRGGALSLLYWLLVLLLGCALASFLWSKPRVRYLLSKWLGSSRRRARGIIPL